MLDKNYDNTKLYRKLKPKMKINNAHDKLFKEIEKHKDNAKDFIKYMLPEKIVKKIDLESLKLDQSSYIDEKLKEYYSDLVYNCLYQGKKKIKITILFEHKSYKPKNEYVQLLRYIISIWEKQEKRKEPLTPVIPVIFYHGKTRWKQKKLFDFFNNIDEDLKQFIPACEYILADVKAFDDIT